MSWSRVSCMSASNQRLFISSGSVSKSKSSPGQSSGPGLWCVVDAEFVAVFPPHGDVQFRVVIAPAGGARVAVHTDGMAALLQGVEV